MGVVKHKKFSVAYAITALSILICSTVFWSTLAAQIHLQNADQLINPYLFSNNDTFQSATLPGQHSFLIKWPLFFVVHLLGSTATAFTTITVLVSLATVSSFVFLLFRIERRPLVFGTLCLILASILLLIPAEPYPGALLPVNFAMLANRNIEYILYIMSLILVAKAGRLWSWQTISSILLLGILVASDKLFLTLSIGGSLISLLLYLICKQRPYIRLSLRWLFVNSIAALFAFGILWLIPILHITHIVTGGSTLGPYTFVQNTKDLLLGVIFGSLGLFTNLGANPAFDTTIAANLPAQALHRLLTAEGIAYLVNLVIAISGFVMAYHITQQSLYKKLIFNKKKLQTPTNDTPLQLSLMLIATTLASLVIFILSSHYYPVDARYLTIVLFTVIIVIATYIRRVQFSFGTITSAGFILICVVLIGIGATWFSYQRSITALSENTNRNQLIASAIAQHPVDSLVGDYWRVLPIKQTLGSNQNIIPLASCTTARDILSSNSWRHNLSLHSFAYILPIEISTTGYPACSIKDVTSTYGRPNSSVLIAGSATHPKEVLLFYDHGTNTVKRNYDLSASILPQAISKLRDTLCTQPTIMNIVAHQDDDLLFMNPDLVHNLTAGDCVRSVYLTAGDGGYGNPLYWLGREQGTEAAYAEMLGIKNPIWTTRTVALADNNELATIASLKDAPRISLVFMHLPDGNLRGQGFPSTRFESLAKLKSRTISVIHTVDQQSNFTSEQLTSALTSLMNAYQPTEIHTQATQNLSKIHPDHSDHIATGTYAETAYAAYAAEKPDIPIKFYIGYPVRDRPQNVFNPDLSAATDAFFTYARHDSAACGSVESCGRMSYGDYLNRQYQMTP
jgi:LmbE family N-acetylglucosaminyl deacetylase